MDDREKVVDRDLKREFRANRHSLSMIAKAFQLLAAEDSSQHHNEGGVQAAEGNSSKLHFQEVFT